MMLIEDRFENKLLKRVELRFKVNHPNATTPSRAKLMEMVKQMEPGGDQGPHHHQRCLHQVRSTADHRTRLHLRA